MKVFLEPSNSKIASFFEETFQIINQTSKEISDAFSNQNPLILQRSELTAKSKYLDAKQKLEFEVVNTIEFSFPFNDDTPSNWLMQIEDDITVFINKMTLADDADSIPDLKAQLFVRLINHKAKLIQSIYHPLTIYRIKGPKEITRSFFNTSIHFVRTIPERVFWSKESKKLEQDYI